MIPRIAFHTPCRTYSYTVTRDGETVTKGGFRTFMQALEAAPSGVPTSGIEAELRRLGL